MIHNPYQGGFYGYDVPYGAGFCASYTGHEGWPVACVYSGSDPALLEVVMGEIRVLASRCDGLFRELTEHSRMITEQGNFNVGLSRQVEQVTEGSLPLLVKKYDDLRGEQSEQFRIIEEQKNVIDSQSESIKHVLRWDLSALVRKYDALFIEQRRAIEEQGDIIKSQSKLIERLGMRCDRLESTIAGEVRAKKQFVDSIERARADTLKSCGTMQAKVGSLGARCDQLNRKLLAMNGALDELRLSAASPRDCSLLQRVLDIESILRAADLPAQTQAIAGSSQNVFPESRVLVVPVFSEETPAHFVNGAEQSQSASLANHYDIFVNKVAHVHPSARLTKDELNAIWRDAAADRHVYNQLLAKASWEKIVSVIWSETCVGRFEVAYLPCVEKCSRLVQKYYLSKDPWIDEVMAHFLRSKDAPSTQPEALRSFFVEHPAFTRWLWSAHTPVEVHRNLKMDVSWLGRTLVFVIYLGCETIAPGYDLENLLQLSLEATNPEALRLLFDTSREDIKRLGLLNELVETKYKKFKFIWDEVRVSCTRRPFNGIAIRL